MSNTFVTDDNDTLGWAEQIPGFEDSVMHSDLNTDYVDGLAHTSRPTVEDESNNDEWSFPATNGDQTSFKTQNLYYDQWPFDRNWRDMDSRRVTGAMDP